MSALQLGRTREPVRPLYVDVTDPDQPAASDPVELGGVPQGWVERAAGDGGRFIFSMREANPDRSGGRRLVVLFEGTRKVREWEQNAAGVFCNGVCGFVGLDSGAATLTVDDRSEALDLDGACGAVVVRQPTGTAIVVLSTSGHAGWRVGADGARRSLDPVAWDVPGACDIRPAQDSWVAGDRWLRWKDDRVTVEPFESADGLRPLYAAIGDTLAMVDVDVSRQMQHSPTDSRGRRHSRGGRRLETNERPGSTSACPLRAVRPSSIRKPI